MQSSTLRQNLLLNTIEHQRGRVRVTGRAKLDQASCECYLAMYEECERALGLPPLAATGSPR